MRHAYAAVRGGMADILAFMHGDTRPGNALHIGHRRIAIDVRAMKHLFLDDAEDTERRRMVGYAGGDRGVGDMDAVAVPMQLLLIDRNENLLRAFRDTRERVLACGFRGFRLMRF